MQCPEYGMSNAKNTGVFDERRGEGSPPQAAKMEEVGGGGGSGGGRGGSSGGGVLGDEGEGLPPAAAVVCSAGSETIVYQNNVRRVRNVSQITKMNHCSSCNQDFSRRDVMLRHMRNVHSDVKNNDPLKPLDISSSMTFIHPFSMVLSGPSFSGKTRWTSDLLQTSLITPLPQRIIWCYGQ